MPRVTHVKALPGFRLRLVFDDGVSGEVDTSARLFGEMFEPLHDPDLFSRVEVDDFGAPRWPNGADLAPDALHDEIVALAARSTASHR